MTLARGGWPGRLTPSLLVVLCVLASGLSAAPWLRAFPLSVGGAPLFGAATLSVLVPALTSRFRLHLWLALLLDVIAFVAYALAAVLHDPFGLDGIVDGLVHGPSQILSFALPLVSPRSLLIAPVALTWLAGALAGQCIARRWTSAFPYAGVFIAFGLAYAATQRAAGVDADAARLRETLLGAAVLATLLALRAGQSWVRQHEAAEASEPSLPFRSLAIGAFTAVVIAVAASLIVQASAFPKRAAEPERPPSVNNSRPLGPVSFVANLRPTSEQDAQPVFTVRLNHAAPGYFAIANVDYYDGAGWSFDRTFRPSGGVLPEDTDPALSTTGPTVLQTYRVASGPLASAPWMPALYRAKNVTGRAVDIDEGSGMIVPANALTADSGYTVESAVTQTPFAQLKAAQATPDTATPTIDSQVPGLLRTTLDRLIREFAAETGVPSAPALPFLHTLQRTLQTKYLLSGAARGSALGTRATSRTATSTSASSAGGSATASTTAAPSPSGSRAERAGSTSFADVLGSILGQRSGTPEQFATLIALVARELGVPARVVTGFRATSGTSASSEILPAGLHTVSTSQAWTWTEIPIVGKGWIVLDATPGQYAATVEKPDTGSASSSSSSALPTRNALVTSASGGNAIARKSEVPATTSAPRQGLVGALLLAAAVLLLLLVLVFGSRTRVRAARRRRAKDPRTRLLGAWQESIDMLTEAGLPELTTATSAEVAALARTWFGASPGDQAAALGRRANAVAYSARTPVHQPEVDEAWAAHRTLRRSVHRQLGWRGRLSAAMRYSPARRRERQLRTASSPARSSAGRRLQVRRNPARRRR